MDDTRVCHNLINQKEKQISYISTPVNPRKIVLMNLSWKEWRHRENGLGDTVGEGGWDELKVAVGYMPIMSKIQITNSGKLYNTGAQPGAQKGWNHSLL